MDHGSGGSAGSDGRALRSGHELVVARDLETGTPLGPPMGTPREYSFGRLVVVEVDGEPVVVALEPTGRQLPGPFDMTEEQVGVSSFALRTGAPAGPVLAADGASIQRMDPALDAIIAPGAVLEKVAGGFGFTEGPVWSNGEIRFSDLTGNKLHAVGADGVVKLLLDKTSGPFRVTSKAATTAAAVGGRTETIYWTNNTSALSANVRISLSMDGGQTFPTVLAESTANDGNAQVTWPDVATTKARIKVEAVENYFFDVNDADITILSDNDGSTPGPEPTTPPTTPGCR